MVGSVEVVDGPNVTVVVISSGVQNVYVVLLPVPIHTKPALRVTVDGALSWVNASELEILKGMGEYFPLLIKIEAQIIPMYENVPSWGKLINYLYAIN